MSEERPHYHVAIVPNTEWDEADDARFDRLPQAAYYVVDTSHLELIGRSLRMPDSAPPPLNPQQAPPSREMLIAEAATAALTDIVAVIRLWPYPQFDLDGLLVLYRTLRDNPPT